MIVQDVSNGNDDSRRCNVIVRAYLQLCRNCQNIGLAKLKPKSVEALVHKCVVDVYKYYGVNWIRTQ